MLSTSHTAGLLRFRMLPAVLALVAGTVQHVPAQTIDWTVELGAEGIVEVQPGNINVPTSRRAVLSQDGATWVSGTTDTDDDDFVLLKLDSAGNRLVSRSLDLGGSDEGGNLLPAADGGIYVTARSTAPLDGTETIMLLKFSADGQEVWRQAFIEPPSRSWTFRGQFVRSESDLYLVWTSFDTSDSTRRVELARVTDQGDHASLRWTSEVLVTSDNISATPRIAVNPAGTRLAVVAEKGPVFGDDALFFAVVDSATGLIEASTTSADDIAGSASLVPPDFGGDGIIRVALRRIDSSISLGLLRFDSNATRLGGTFRECTGSCALADLHVDASGVAHILGRDELSSGEQSALLIRFAASGALEWEREIFPDSNGVALAGDPDGIAVGFSARPDPNDLSTLAFALARVDATGNLIDPPGFAAIETGAATPIAMHRDDDGVFHLLAQSTFENLLAVSQFAFDEPDPRFVVDQGPITTPLTNSPGQSALALDSLDRPLLALQGELAEGKVSSLVAIGADSAERWRRETDPAINEDRPRVVVSNAGEARLHTLVGGFSDAQLSLRRISDTDGADLGAIQSFSAPSSSRLRIAGDGQGNSVAAYREQDSDAGTLDIVVRYFDADGTPLRDVSPGGPARFEALAVARPQSSDRAYIFGNGAVDGGPALGHLLALNLAAPALNVLPPRLDFGELPLGQTSATQMAVIENNGAGNLDLAPVALTGPQASEFALVADTCSGTRVGAGEACGVEVEFTPQAAGVRRAGVVIDSNDPDAPHELELIGTHDVLFFSGFEPTP